MVVLVHPYAFDIEKIGVSTVCEKMRERENIERKQSENERYFLYNIRTEFHCVSVQLYIITLHHNRLTIIPNNVGLVLVKEHVGFMYTREGQVQL
jgi:hypothetical protein